MSGEGPIVITGAYLQPLASCGVSPFQLTQWYCAIALEMKLKEIAPGAKAFRRSVRVFACQHLGLKRSTKGEVVREHIRKVMREGGFPLKEDREPEPQS